MQNRRLTNLERIMDKEVKMKAWVARDESDQLWLCNHKPYVHDGILIGRQFLVYYTEFPDLKFGDEPVEVEVTIKKRV